MKYSLGMLMTFWAGVSAIYEVPVHKDNVWGQSKTARKMKGWCVFELNESRDAGDIKMDLIFNKPTRNLQIWIMNIDKILNKGRAYELSSRYPYQNTMLKVEFILTYRGSKKRFPRGSCISNITPPSTTTQAPTTHAPVTSQASTTRTTSVTQQPSTTSAPRSSTTTIPESFSDVIPISVEGQHWSVGNGYRITGICVFKIKPKLKSYGIMVEFDKETYGMTDWTMDIEDQQSNGLWYYLKNRWPERQNEIRLRFQVDFDSLPVPSGTCTIDRNGQTLTPKPSTAMPTPTTKAPTQQPSTAAPTQQPSTAAPTQQPSTAAPTQQPSTAAPTQQPSTAAPTQQPSTAAPTQQPSTAAPTQQPSTAAPTQQPSTAAPTQQPSTAAPTTGAPVNTAHDYNSILHESILFYEAQQAGYLTNNRVSWRSNATTLDRGIYGEDLTGGWYDVTSLADSFV
ncbi:mucin-2-like [Saccostrea cucullata]|uniref:mucin-2-like n=1 Tax=Saccostrea cuccullata TaxID=36930 RepID=UPI002ED44484